MTTWNGHGRRGSCSCPRRKSTYRSGIGPRRPRPQALPLQERALAVTEAALGPDHPDTGIRLDNLAHMLAELGRHEEALALRQRANSMRRKP